MGLLRPVSCGIGYHNPTNQPGKVRSGVGDGPGVTSVFHACYLISGQQERWSRMEIEAKFRVEDSGVFAKLLAIRSLGPYAFEVVPEAEIQQNTYFDTEDGRVRRAHHALRVRTIGEKRIASFKGPTRIVDAVHERDEWEVEIGDDASPASWPKSEARTRALAMVGTECLQPIVQIHTIRRHIRVVLRGSAVADLCLDEGTISAGGRRVPFRELEIESAPEASRSEFDALVTRIEKQEKLIAEPESKFARGLELLDTA